MATSSSDGVVGHTALPQEDKHQPGTDHPYYQTLVRCTDKLVRALSGSPLSIADRLQARLLITPETYSSLLVASLTPDNMARKMLIGVRRTVQLNSRKYIDFVQILQDDISLLSSGIVKHLHDTYSEIKREIQNEYCIHSNQAQEQPQTSVSHQASSISPVPDNPSTATCISRHLVPISAEHSQEIKVAQKTKMSLTEKFEQIVICMNDVLKESNQTVGEFRISFLLCLDVFERDRHANFFESKANALCQASTFDALFMVLNLYWDYLNYHLLECLVRKYGDADTKRSMKEYVEDVSSFMEATTLQVFWKIEPCLKSIPPPGFTETIVRYKHGISAISTLKDVENIRLKIKEKTQIREFAILLSAIKEGSLLITWFTRFHCEHQTIPSRGIISQRISAVLYCNTDPCVRPGYGLGPEYIIVGHSFLGHRLHLIDRLSVLFRQQEPVKIDEFFGGDIEIASTPLSVLDIPTIVEQMTPSDVQVIKESFEVVQAMLYSGYDQDIVETFEVLLEPEFSDMIHRGFLTRPNIVDEFIKLWITKYQNPTWETLVAFFRKIGAHGAAQKVENIIPSISSPVLVSQLPVHAESKKRD